MKINIPVSRAARGYGAPDVCAAHGQPAWTRRVAVTAHPSWTWGFLLLGVFPFFLVRAFTGKTVLLPAWPFCDRCRSWRDKCFVASFLLVLLGLATLCVPVGSMSIGYPIGPEATVIGVLLILAGSIALSWASWAYVARIQVDEALAWITVVNAHPEFAGSWARDHETTR